MSESSVTLIDQLLGNAEFRAGYIADPKPVLAQLGIVYPETTAVHVVEVGPRHLALILSTEVSYTTEQFAAMSFQSAAVIKRSFIDAEFKALLLENPIEAIFLETGYRVPDGTSVSVHLTTPTDVYLPILSLSIAYEEEDLSELELDQVAGGRNTTPISSGNKNTPAVHARSTPGVYLI